jgi:MFS family permease
MADADCPARTASTPSLPWPSARVAWTAMIALALVRLSAQLDAGVMALLVEPIKKDLGLSDSAVAPLLGLAFTLFHLGLAVPMAVLADRWSRKTLLALGVTVWSLMTAACGLANSFTGLFWARVGVGAGESVNGPPTYSMIADLFPRERLARAISVMNLGSIGGRGLSLVIGAVVIQMLAHSELPTLPLIGRPRHWQAVFFLVGLPGLAIALTVYFLPEPVRRGLRGQSANVLTVLRHIAANRRYFLPLFAAVMLGGMESGGSAQWRPSFFVRTYGWTAQQAGFVSGISELVTGPLGLFLGTMLAERFARRQTDGELRVVAIGWACATPCMIVAPLVDNVWLSVALFALSGMFAMMSAPTQNAALQSVTPNEMRGQLTALYLLAYTLASQGVGPSFIAAITNGLVQDEALLRYALAGSAAVVMPLAVVVMLLGARPYGREIARLKLLGV